MLKRIIKKLINGNERQLSGPPMKKIYTDKNGINYYTLENPAQIPAMRYYVGMRSVADMAIGLDREKVLTMLRRITDAINKGDMVDAAYNAEALRLAISNTDPADAYVQLAAVWCVEEGEPLLPFDMQRTKAKLERWKHDPEARNFFLIMGYELAINSEAFYKAVTQL